MVGDLTAVRIIIIGALIDQLPFYSFRKLYLLLFLLLLPLLDLFFWQMTGLQVNGIEQIRPIVLPLWVDSFGIQEINLIERCSHIMSNDNKVRSTGNHAEENKSSSIVCEKCKGNNYGVAVYL